MTVDLRREALPAVSSVSRRRKRGNCTNTGILEGVCWTQCLVQVSRAIQHTSHKWLLSGLGGIRNLGNLDDGALCNMS